MRGRSFTGPIILLGLGLLFLWSNLHPGFQVLDMLGQYWPFLLILVGPGALDRGSAAQRECLRKQLHRR